jgi:predicted TIM-barrel fold metal-dependent hydrolase
MDRISGSQFVDTHFHLWDPASSGLRYAQLEDEFDNGRLSDRLDRLKGTRYVLADFLTDMADVRLVKAVHVQAALGTSDPVAETAWLQSIADANGFPHGIVAEVDLRAADVQRQLDRHCAFPNMRGVRVLHVSRELLEDHRFMDGCRALEARGLICELGCKWPEMESARELAQAVPGAVLVLDHVGLPMDGDPEYIRNWSHAIQDLAQAENIRCKISGLALCNPRWTIETLRPWIETAIEAFGPGRVVFGSNWPVDKFTPFSVLFGAYVTLTEQYGENEQRMMLTANGERLYRL